MKSIPICVCLALLFVLAAFQEKVDQWADRRPLEKALKVPYPQTAMARWAVQMIAVHKYNQEAREAMNTAIECDALQAVVQKLSSERPAEAKVRCDLNFLCFQRRWQLAEQEANLSDLGRLMEKEGFLPGKDEFPGAADSEKNSQLNPFRL